MNSKVAFQVKSFTNKFLICHEFGMKVSSSMYWLDVFFFLPLPSSICSSALPYSHGWGRLGRGPRRWLRAVCLLTGILLRRKSNTNDFILCSCRKCYSGFWLWDRRPTRQKWDRPKRFGNISWLDGKLHISLCHFPKGNYSTVINRVSYTC